MTNLLIADDEQIERDALEFMASKSGLELNCFKAKNGKEAVDIVAKNPIGIAILDIKMPLMDGMEAARIIREISPSTLIVFLTAWGLFDYAREAVRLGAEDYLVKPCTNDTFCSLMKKCLQRLEKQEKPKKDIQVMMNLFTREFFTSLKYGGVPEETVKSFLRLKGITAWQGIALFIDSPNSQEFGRWWTTEAWLKEIPVCYYSGLDRMVLLAFTDKTDLLKKRITNFDSTSGEYCIGLGKPFSKTGEIANSVHTASIAYLEAIRAKNRLFIYKEDIDKKSSASRKIVVEDILNEIRQRNSNGALGLGHKAVDQIVSEFGSSDVACENLYELAVVLSHEMASLVPNFWFPSPLRGSMGEMDTFLMDLINAACEALISDSKDKYGRTFEQIKQYISENYAKITSSGEVSELFKISPSYFPKLFKERLGMTFVEYLTSVRMNEAVKLLEQGLTVKEVAFRTGFVDSSYFSRVFRQTFKRSPRQTRIF